MASMTEKEKEMQKKLIGFDKAKELYSNISAILDVEDWGWTLTKKYTLKPNALSLTFQLTESAVEDELRKRDKEQMTLEQSINPKRKKIPD